MDGLSDSWVFTHGWSKLVELVVLDDSIYGDDGYNLLIASEHKQKLRTDETDVDEGVVGDGENDYMQLSTFESILNDTGDSKFDQCFSSLIEMEDVKKKGKLITMFLLAYFIKFN
ncbi:hypothetical protein HanPI659440_Chr11g0424891 [Helianthus annuus]|nr:hypothetical protein HanPI659440_Chr11g0424891 [Helianthus annuus]